MTASPPRASAGVGPVTASAVAATVGDFKQYCDEPVGEGVDVQPGWDMAVQAAPDYEVDQRTNW